MASMNNNGDQNAIDDLLSRYVENTFPSRDRIKEILSSGKKLTFYLGVDPTGPDIHLGNATNLLWLKKLIKLRHRAIVLVGDFTAQVGDPTDKESVRKDLTEEEIAKNMETYVSQAEKILPKGSFEIRYNSQWYKKMGFKDVISLTKRFTVQQMIVRDMFQERLKKDRPIHIHEFIYPIMQGYDSVAMEVDGEVGGNDQTFNMLVGRDLVRDILNKEKIVIATKLLIDPTTNKKIMNKSEGRYISLNDTSFDMFGKVMAMPDSTIIPLFENATEISQQKIEEFKKIIASGENPNKLKKELAYEIVKMYHGEEEASKAQDEFSKIFSNKELPTDMPEWEGGLTPLADLLVKAGLVQSKTEAKRIIEQKGVTINNEEVENWNQQVKKGDVIKVGPRKFLRIK